MRKKTDSSKYAVILAGGGGTRLWPRSRNAYPKQFLSIGQDGTLLQNTYRRLKGKIPKNQIFVVATSEYIGEIRKQLPELSEENIFIEPLSKNTAAAIALAVWEINKKDEDAVIGSFASDHLIKDDKEFQKVLNTAYDAATFSDNLLTVGILPSKADASLGYIHIGKQLGEFGGKPIFQVKKFLEKPQIALAKALIASGEYFWNASYFIGKARTFLELFKRYTPEILTVIMSSTGKGLKEKQKLWESLKGEAIDYGIMEKADNLAVVTGDLGWSDVGNWSVLSEVFPKGAQGNVLLGDIKGKSILLDSKDCLVFGAGKLIATIGVSNLIIVETSDVILICNKDRAQDVKKIVEKLKNDGKEKYL